MFDKKTEKRGLNTIQKRLSSLEKDITEIKNLLIGERSKKISSQGSSATVPSDFEEGRVIKGFFDGEKMQGEDGQEYEIPANYASKSKLIEGDVLKLTITNDGTFIYKQIGPVDRRRVIGNLDSDESGNYKVITPEKSYRVLLASVTYFKAQLGDQITLVIPRDRECVWGAIENVVKRSLPQEETSLIKEKGTPQEEISAEEAPQEKIETPFEEGSELEDIDDLDDNRETFTI